MPRTDENGRQLKSLLDYLLDGGVEAQDIYAALGISSSAYYRRIKEDDYPDAEELRKVADNVGLSYLDLQVRFGLIGKQEVQGYLNSGPLALAVETAIKVRPRLKKLSELRQRLDAPPL